MQNDAGKTQTVASHKSFCSDIWQQSYQKNSEEFVDGQEEIIIGEIFAQHHYIRNPELLRPPSQLQFCHLLTLNYQ